jgi:hypothetical protein
MRDRLVSLALPLGTIGLLLLPVDLARADGGATLHPVARRVTVNFYGQARLGWPGSDLERALRAGDFGDYDPGEPFDPGTQSSVGPTPRSSDGRWGYCVAVGYAVDPNWEIRGLVSSEEALRSYGASIGLYRLWLQLESSSERYAATLVYRPWAWLVRVGAGPALTSSEVTAVTAYDRLTPNSESRVGYVLDAGVSWPRRSRLFVDAGAQYWHGGDVEFGPYNVQNGIGHIERVFPRSRHSLNRTCAGLSVGLRM